MTLHNSLVVVLAAGEGTRMRSRLPKVAHRIAGRAMIGHVLASATAFGSGSRAVVIGPGMGEVEALVRAADSEAEIFVQRERLGTAHAVLSARAALERGADHVFVLFGDTPLVRPETLRRLSEGLAGGADIVVLGFCAANPTGYGRLLVRDGRLEAIREERDASPEERKVDLCNSGVMAIAGRLLPELLDSVDNGNAKKEFYLTDVVALARARGLTAVALEAEESEVQGINTRTQLAEVEAVLQRRLRAKAMEAGVTLIAPDTVFLAHDTVLGADVIVEPNVFFGEGVMVGEGTVIHAFSHLVEVTIDAGAEIGPFARLRPGADIGPGVKIGNFVEVKAARIEAGAKVPHLSYVGNARIGPKANIGAGTITCNYDGFRKHHTDVGAGAFVGSNSSLVAPVSIGDGAYIGSGSVITKNVTADALAVGRAQQVEKPGWAKAFREKMLTMLGKTAKHSMK